MEQVQAMGDLAAQKQWFGEHIYQRLAPHYPGDKAGRLVGMILAAFSPEQLLQCLNDQAFFQQSVQHAAQTLESHQATGEQAAQQ
jgi:hypothetical protein